MTPQSNLRQRERAVWEPCGRVLVGQGSDTWDPICLRTAGHRGVCSPTKPHLYRWGGNWWISRNGRDSFRRGVCLNDSPAPSLEWAIDFIRTCS